MSRNQRQVGEATGQTGLFFWYPGRIYLSNKRWYKTNICSSSTSVISKMQWKCLLIFAVSLVDVIHSATISKKSIPVKVVYEKEYNHKSYNRNLDEKVQLSPGELQQIGSRLADVREQSQETSLNALNIPNEENEENGSVKNLKEKVQVPSEILRNHNEKVQLSSEELGEALKHLPINDDIDGSLRLAVPEGFDDTDLYQKVNDIVKSGVQHLKNNAKESELSKYITYDTWAKLDLEAEKFLKQIKSKYSLRQSNQNILAQFQQFANNFLNQLANPANTSSDEAQPSFPQNVINFFTNGFQQIQSGLGSLTGQNQQSSTVQNDPDVSTKPPNNNNPIQGFVTSVQGVFTQLNPFNQGQGQNPSTQGEESNQPNGPLQSIQNAFNQFGETINNLNPFNQQTQKPGTAGDDVTTAGPFQVIQGIASQAGQVLNQLNPFQQSTTKAPNADPTKNPIQSVAENFGNQISTGISNLTAGNNPISGIAQAVQGAASQVGESLAGSNPLQEGSNPLQVAQGVAQQVSEVISSNNPLQNGTNPLQAAQGVVEQVGSALTGSNPSPDASASTDSKEFLESAENTSDVEQQKKNETGVRKVQLAGGAEYEVPLTVIKVAENSIAENAGMQEGDVVVRLNDIPMTGLTHNEAHDALLAAGNDFKIAVRRGDLSHLPPRLLLYETSVENAEDMVNQLNEAKHDSENNDNDLNITDEEIANIIGEQVQFSSQKVTGKSSVDLKQIEESSVEMKQTERSSIEVKQEISVHHKQSEVSKIVLSEESQQTPERKWSTFLQKPKNPKPNPKIVKVEPKAPPYRVIIKKQPKKDQQITKEVTTEEDISYQTSTLEYEEVSHDYEEDFTTTDKEEEDRGQTEDIDVNENDVNESSQEVEIESKCEEIEEKEVTVPETENITFSNKRLSINIEEQLAQVKQQLEALAQLPSAIQQTLNAVTQQLSEIVCTQHSQEQEIAIAARSTCHEESTEEYLEISEHEEEALSVLEEECYEHYDEEVTEETKEEVPHDVVKNESDDEQALFEKLEKQIEEEEKRRLEELEARKMEQEKIQKRDKERRPSQLQTPLQRPIILPGGRKWTNPDDAVSKIRRPSLTDEKIANTINMFSEVNHWNNIWPWSDTEKPVYRINFLKYQPPPRNLEHLQKSAVYRLVHDIEPPPRGVIARDSKILAEQDYYTERLVNTEQTDGCSYCVTDAHDRVIPNTCSVDYFVDEQGDR
ncbi:hypothetical protein Trydic_g10356 [Trypoxylus dichotomus]